MDARSSYLVEQMPFWAPEGVSLRAADWLESKLDSKQLRNFKRRRNAWVPWPSGSKHLQSSHSGANGTEYFGRADPRYSAESGLATVSSRGSPTTYYPFWLRCSGRAQISVSDCPTPSGSRFLELAPGRSRCNSCLDSGSQRKPPCSLLH